MFADLVIREVLASLKNKIDFAHVLALDEVYPTSGEQFVRVYGARSVSEYEGSRMKLAVTIAIDVSRRIQHTNVELRGEDYLKLVNLAEKVFLHVTTATDIIQGIANKLPARATTYGRFTSSYLDLRAEKLSASDYHSTDNADRKPVGIKLSQEFQSPTINLSIDCGNLPDGFIPGFE